MKSKSILPLTTEDNYDFYAPNFEEVEEACWFGPVCACVHPWVTLCIWPRMVRDRILKFDIHRISMKNKRTCIFFLFLRTFGCRAMPLFQRFFFFFFLLCYYKPMEPCQQNSWRTA